MDRLDAMRVFASVVDQGSLAAAARRLRLSPVAVTRAVASLEKHLGAALLTRSTRAMRLTQAGERYLQACRNVIAELASAEESVGSEQGELRGLLSISAPATFGRLHVRPVLDGFLDAHPQLSLRLLLLDRIVNLVEEGFDAAIRIGHLPDSALAAVKLGQVRRLVCASPDYLARHPPLRRPGISRGMAASSSRKAPQTRSGASRTPRVAGRWRVRAFGSASMMLSARSRRRSRTRRDAGPVLSGASRAALRQAHPRADRIRAGAFAGASRLRRAETWDSAPARARRLCGAGSARRARRDRAGLAPAL